MESRQLAVMDVRRILWGGGVSHHDHLVSLLSSLQTSQCLVDLSLVCQTGQIIKTHKIVLAAASPLLRSLLQDNDKKVVISDIFQIDSVGSIDLDICSTLS